jgi:PhnB protein
MEQVNIPDGYNRVMPYLILDNAAAFSDFMQKVFHADEVQRHMRDESIIMHGELKIGDSIIMFADSTEKFKSRTAGMFIYVKNADETYNMALKEGATSLMGPADQPYGRSCGIMDAYGNIWWVTSL